MYVVTLYGWENKIRLSYRISWGKIDKDCMTIKAHEIFSQTLIRAMNRLSPKNGSPRKMTHTKTQAIPDQERHGPCGWIRIDNLCDQTAKDAWCSTSSNHLVRHNPLLTRAFAAKRLGLWAELMIIITRDKIITCPPLLDSVFSFHSFPSSRLFICH